MFPMYNINEFINLIDKFLSNPTINSAHSFLTNPYMFGGFGAAPGRVSAKAIYYDCQFHHHVLGGQERSQQYCDRCPFAHKGNLVTKNQAFYSNCSLVHSFVLFEVPPHYSDVTCLDTNEQYGLSKCSLVNLIPKLIMGLITMKAICEIKKEKLRQVNEKRRMSRGKSQNP